jgi:tetratricopeptide (TPR) repeat protein
MVWRGRTCWSAALTIGSAIERWRSRPTTKPPGSRLPAMPTASAPAPARRSVVGRAYRLSIEGLRALERGENDRAVSILARAVALTPDDPVASYRYASALQAIGDATRAKSTRERVIQARPPAPAIVLASAYVDAATICEREGERERALTLYQRAIAVVGGAPRAYEDARLGLKRLSPKIF